jgi:microcystin-dependent protein
MDQFMNVTGVNDLYCQRFFVNNVPFNPVDFNTTQTNTQQINYSSGTIPLTRISKNNYNILFIPQNPIPGAYNFISQPNDNIICTTVNANNEPTVLTITNQSSSKSGFRIKSDETEAYNLKVLDGGLKFSDNTVQTTAMTNTYLTNLIQTILNQNLATLVPVGTIMPYAGDLESNVPNGYFWCIGGLTTIEGSPNLFNVIGHKFSYGQYIYPGSYYLPDLRGAHLKGCSVSNIFSGKTTAINSVGNYQFNNVGSHAHLYKDRGSGSYKIANQSPAPGISPNVADDTDKDFWTDGNSYDSSTHVLSDPETRPNSVGINYIIKY